MSDKITVKQASELSGYSEGHLRRLCEQGAIGARKFANAWAIDKDSFLVFVREQKAKDSRHGPQ